MKLKQKKAKEAKKTIAFKKIIKKLKHIIKMQVSWKKSKMKNMKKMTKMINFKNCAIKLKLKRENKLRSKSKQFSCLFLDRYAIKVSRNPLKNYKI